MLLFLKGINDNYPSSLCLWLFDPPPLLYTYHPPLHFKKIDMTTTNSDFNEAIVDFMLIHAGLVVQFIMDTQSTINVQCKYNFL